LAILTVYETRIISTGVNLLDEETEVMHDQLESLCVTVDQSCGGISQKDISERLCGATGRVLRTRSENVEESLGVRSLRGKSEGDETGIKALTLNNAMHIPRSANLIYGQC
jgi:hypothetical protein